MHETTTELATRQIIQPLPVSEVIVDVTGAWSMEEDDDDISVAREVVEHPLEQSRRRRFGHAVYWLTHPRYRREVRERASDIILDMNDSGVAAKQVLPPRTRDFKSVPERRRHTADLALDIKQYIQTMRRIRRLIGVFTLMTTDQLETISPSPMVEQVHAEAPVPAPVLAIEEQLPPLDGEAPNDSDFIAKIVVDP